MLFLLSDGMKIGLSVIVVIVCVFLFVGTYLLNKHTKAPEGCEDHSQECSGCAMIGCSHHPDKKDENVKEEKENKENND